MARRRMYENRRVFSFNLDVENMKRMENLYPNMSEKLNELISNHLERIQSGLDDIEFKKKQVQQEIDSLKGELNLLDKEKREIIEAERQKEQELILQKKKEKLRQERTVRTKKILESMDLKVKSFSELNEPQRKEFWKKWRELGDKTKA